jgi:predicted nucleic acid-binding protein
MGGRRQEAGTVIISPFVLTEVDHLAKARCGSHARTVIIEFVLAQARQLRFELPAVGLEMLETARAVQRQYADLDLDLADAANVGLAARYRTDAVLTLDRRDFRAIGPSPAISGSSCYPTTYSQPVRREQRKS